MIPVSFVINITGDNNQTESGPATITNEVFTISAGSGTVVSAGGPQGYTTTGTGTSTATVKGTGETSFTISAGVEYTDAEAGTHSVTCNGTVYFSDGTNAPNSGTVQVAAVAVDSVALAGPPSNYTLGQKLTRKDFTITTTPGGFGSYTFPGTTNYLVTFSPATSFNIAVGDNVVTASCGDTSASIDVIGVGETASWTSSSYNPNTNTVTSNFTAEIDGINGTYSVTGANAAGGDTSGNLADGVPFSGAVTTNPDSAGNDYITVSTPSSDSGTSGGSADAATGAAAAGGALTITKNSTTGLLWDAAGVVVGLVGGGPIGGAVVFAAELQFLSEDVQVTPNGLTQLLSLTTNKVCIPPITQVTSTCTWSASGTAYWGVLAGYYCTSDPKFQVDCQAPSQQGPVIDTANGITVDFETTSFVGLPVVRPQFPVGEATAFCGGNPVGVINSGPNATEAKGSYAGNCGIVSGAGAGFLWTNPNDPNWVAGPAPFPSSQEIQVKWYH